MKSRVDGDAPFGIHQRGLPIAVVVGASGMVGGRLAQILAVEGRVWVKAIVRDDRSDVRHLAVRVSLA